MRLSSLVSVSRCLGSSQEQAKPSAETFDSLPDRSFTMVTLIDLVLSSIALICLSPLFLLAAAGIRLCSPGPIFYRAKRVGIGGKIFTMYKFRTMHVNHGPAGSCITAQNDSRVFAFGSWLRRLKIDELPQLVNILRREMAIVGPRPEDPTIVERHYNSDQLETLRILPGLSSPGSIYFYTHGEKTLNGKDPEGEYVERLLPVKLALDLIYVHEVSVLYNLRVILRTIWVVAAIALGKRDFPDPREMSKARHLGLIPKSL
jgi:lipopolysaccharide/colanic/teichoic acid biosynthesis glycosyltransferase